MEKAWPGPESGSTRTFAERTGLRYALDDTDHDVLLQYFSANREGSSNSDFVVINGVAGSPSHQQWEILYQQPRGLNVTAIREVAESVGAPVVAPPCLGNPEYQNGAIQFVIKGQSNSTYLIQASSDGEQWQDLQTITVDQAETLFIDESSTSHQRRFYRAVAQ